MKALAAFSLSVCTKHPSMVARRGMNRQHPSALCGERDGDRKPPTGPRRTPPSLCPSLLGLDYQLRSTVPQ